MKATSIGDFRIIASGIRPDHIPALLRQISSKSFKTWKGRGLTYLIFLDARGGASFLEFFPVWHRSITHEFDDGSYVFALHPKAVERIMQMLHEGETMSELMVRLDSVKYGLH